MSSAVTVKGAVYPMQWMRLIMTCCGMAEQRMGMIDVGVRKIKALIVKMEIVALIGTGR
jgi:hypothetical protein